MNGAAFVDDIVAASPELREALVKFMQAAAVRRRAMRRRPLPSGRSNPLDQRPFALDLFYGELVASGREANSDATKGFTRGYAAIDALFPGSREEDPAGSVFKGDLTLAFSRIYTLDGGDITRRARRHCSTSVWRIRRRRSPEQPARSVAARHRRAAGGQSQTSSPTTMCW